METIPLRPVFQNDKFNELSPALQGYIVRAIYLLAQERRLYPLPEHLRKYFHCCNAHFHRNKAVFREVLEEIVPKILKIKNAKRNQTLDAHQANRDKPKKHKDNQGYGELVEPIIENQAPLLPQHSAFAAQLRKERIPNEHVFKNPIKPATNSKPMLKETPR